jgi:uncharacterized protein (TIGR02722 family)
MKLNKIAVLAVLGVLALTFSACGPSKVVSRVDSGEVIDLSGNWNDTDSQLVSQDMITQSLGEIWLQRFTSKNNGKEPRIIVGRVVNKAQEHINTETFVKDLQRALINSGRVEFVAGGDQREAVRSERSDQASNAKDAKRQNYENAADFMLTGTINTIFDQEGGKEVKYYQINLELTNIESNTIVWTGEKKIKKFVSKKKYKA